MQGHQVAAQIAFDNLTPAAKEQCYKHLHTRSQQSFNTHFIKAAIWMDLIKLKNIHWYDTFHYIDIPFSNDGTTVPSIESINAVWGINNAVKVLSTKKTKPADKELALRILIHLVGDIHQPLHAVTKVSTQLPNGDRGGNLFPLGKNNVGNNLHKYWDNGAGFFTGKNKLYLIKDKAQLLEKKWPCSNFGTQKNPEMWAKSSHEVAVTQAYQINPKEIPNKQYQINAQNTAQKQVAMAGCRLALLLNDIAK